MAVVIVFRLWTLVWSNLSFQSAGSEKREEGLESNEATEGNHGSDALLYITDLKTVFAVCFRGITENL